MDPRVTLGWRRKSRPHRDSVSGPSSSERDAILTELSRPTGLQTIYLHSNFTSK